MKTLLAFALLMGSPLRAEDDSRRRFLNTVWTAGTVISMSFSPDELRPEAELLETDSRIASAECGDYVLLAYRDRAVLSWRTPQPLTPDPEYGARSLRTEYFHGEDMELVIRAVFRAPDSAIVRDLRDRDFDSDNHWTVVEQDASSTPLRCQRPVS